MSFHPHKRPIKVLAFDYNSLLSSLTRSLDYSAFFHGGVPGQAAGTLLGSLKRLTQSDEKFKLGRRFMTLISEKSHLKVPRRWKEGAVLWGREIWRKKDIHFWPFCRNTRWPMEKWRISPCKPLTAPPLTFPTSPPHSGIWVACLDNLMQILEQKASAEFIPAFRFLAI